MNNPKTKAILEQVRILAQTYPDFVYTHSGCHYNSGGDPKYPHLCGCIIGQAARAVGIDTSDWDLAAEYDEYGSTEIFLRVNDRLDEDPFQRDVLTLKYIQCYQDQGTPWGEAYVKAMEKHS